MSVTGQKRPWPYDGPEGRARLTGSPDTGGSFTGDDDDPECRQSTTACYPRQTIPDSCSCPDHCEHDINDPPHDAPCPEGCPEDEIEIYDVVLPAMVTPPVVPFPNRWSDGPSLVELDAYGDFAPERRGQE